MSAGDSPLDPADPSEPGDTQADAELAAMGFTIGPEEVFCRQCYMIHRPELGCEDSW